MTPLEAQQLLSDHDLLLALLTYRARRLAQEEVRARVAEGVTIEVLTVAWHDRLQAADILAGQFDQLMARAGV